MAANRPCHRSVAQLLDLLFAGKRGESPVSPGFDDRVGRAATHHQARATAPHFASNSATKLAALTGLSPALRDTLILVALAP